MKIVSWNIRGINDLSKRILIGEVLSSSKPNWVALQEIKMS